jgi:hypothetical protein
VQPVRHVLAKFERSVAGRAIISIGAVVVLVAVIVLNMPDSQLRTDVNRYTLPVINATGLNQNWGIFSNPRTLSAYVDGRIDFADGSSSLVPISTSNWFGAYASYRWQKYEEVIRLDSGSIYWHDYAEYLATNASTHGRHPIRVTIIRLFAQTLPPGPGPSHGPWQESTMYVLNVGPAQ